MTKLASLANWLGRHDRRVAAAAVAFVLVAGTGYALSLGDQLRYLDERQYLALASNLSSKGAYTIDGTHPSAYHPPAYPVLLLLFRSIGFGIVGLRLVNFVLLAVSVVLAWALARRVGGRVAASLAALGLAVYPLSFYTAGTLYPQTMAIALLLGGLLAMVAATDPGRAVVGRLVLAGTGGLLFGVLTVTVPQLVPAFAAVLLWLAFTRRRRAAMLIVVALIAAIPLPVAWTIRDATQFHTLVLITTQDGHELLLGNSENTRPNSGALTNISAYQTIAQSRYPFDEAAQNTYYRDQALTYIRTHPSREVLLYVEKVVNYFNFRNDLFTAAQQSRVNDLLSAVSFYPFLILLVLRLATYRRRRPSPLELLLTGLFLGFALVEAVYFTRLRYRLPLDPLLIIVAVSFLATWVTARGAREGREGILTGTGTA
jgi:4-amino-4-deoxy-L-arabinose transferase-like glycosyltransferase